MTQTARSSDPPVSGVPVSAAQRARGSGTHTSSKPWFEDPTLALAERIARAPHDGRVKGWLMQSIVDNARRHGVDVAGDRKYLGFKDYPVREYLELLAEAAVRVRPGRPAEETLRTLGQGVFPSFAESLFGKVILVGLGKGHDGAKTGLRLITQVYKRTSNHAVARFSKPSDNEAIIELSNVWSFPDSYHVGIFEGAAQGFQGRVTVEIRSRSLSEAVLYFLWNDA